MCARHARHPGNMGAAVLLHALISQGKPEPLVYTSTSLKPDMGAAHQGHVHRGARGCSSTMGGCAKVLLLLLLLL